MDAILFDWDGTLFDSIGALYRANVDVMESFGLPFDEPAYRRHFYPDWRLMYRSLGIPEDRLEEANALWHSRFDTLGKVGLLEGAADALEAVVGSGRQLGLVTAGHRSLVEPQLARTGVARHFAVTVFGDDLDVHKPDPAPLRLALSRLGLETRPSATIYVGDTPADMRMARTVGTRAVGIASLLGDPGALRDAGAEEVAPSVRDWVGRRLGDGFPRPAMVERRRVGEGVVSDTATGPHRE